MSGQRHLNVRGSRSPLVVARGRTQARGGVCRCCEQARSVMNRTGRDTAAANTPTTLEGWRSRDRAAKVGWTITAAPVVVALTLSWHSTTYCLGRRRGRGRSRASRRSRSPRWGRSQWSSGQPGGCCLCRCCCDCRWCSPMRLRRVQVGAERERQTNATRADRSARAWAVA